ncbi:MAG: HipA family kinase [Omnitrophica WOR_2 bacterium]|jgi:hypothetical protein
MLPIYEAIDILEIIPETAGHTRPWVVTANTPSGLGVFVVKMYNQRQVQDHCIITREIVSNLIAKQFDLFVPEVALINIPEELAFRQGYTEQMLFNDADSNLKFASIRLKRSIGVIHGFPSRILKQKIDLDTLYAFDNLIRNQDRGQFKVNLLFSDKQVYLIDHELALQSNDINISRNEILIPEDKFTKYHFAYPYLRKYRGVKKKALFNNFQEYLRLLNTRKLEPYFNQLQQLGFPDYSDKIVAWISHIKQNSTIFVERLKISLK